MSAIAATMLVFVTVAAMEGIAWSSHKYIMHGFGWAWHRDHAMPSIAATVTSTITRAENADMIAL